MSSPKPSSGTRHARPRVSGKGAVASEPHERPGSSLHRLHSQQLWILPDASEQPMLMIDRASLGRRVPGACDFAQVLPATTQAHRADTEARQGGRCQGHVPWPVGTQGTVAGVCLVLTQVHPAKAPAPRVAQHRDRDMCPLGPLTQPEGMGAVEMPPGANPRAGPGQGLSSGW